MKLESAASYITRNGFLPRVHAGLHKGLNRIVRFNVLKGMTLKIDDIPDRYLDLPVRHDCGFIDEHTLYRLAGNAENELSREFIAWALGRGDTCYGFVDGKRLAAYAWYSKRPTEIMPHLVLHFDPTYVCMYKTFTHPDYRDQRLLGIGMAKAAQAFADQGKKGLISCVESHDHPALHSCERLGCRVFGSIWVLGHHGHYLTARTPRCRRFSFSVAAA